MNECPHYEIVYVEVKGKTIQRRRHLAHPECMSDPVMPTGVSDFARRYGKKIKRRKASPASLVTHVALPDRSRQATGQHAAAVKRVPRTVEAIRAELDGA